MYSIVILWDSSKEYFEQIIDDISRAVVIEKIKHFKLFDEYSNFIIDIYEFNNQKELGIFKSTMMYDGARDYELVILKIKTDNVKIGIYDLTKQLKKNIRSTYKTFVNYYFHDNIIHATDCFEEFEHVVNVLKKYECQL